MTNQNKPFNNCAIHCVFNSTFLIENILSKYLSEVVVSCKLLKRGLNDTYLVESEVGRYILRVYRREWRKKQEIDFELELLNFLHNKGEAVANPIPVKNGVFTTEIDSPEGLRYAAMFAYAPGKAVNQKINNIQSYNLGKLLAKIHTSTDSFQSRFSRPVLDNDYLLDWSIKNIRNLYDENYDENKVDLSDLEEEIKKIKQQLEKNKLSLSAPEYGICIGDLHSGNAHFTPDNKPTLFDFDQCGYGWRAFDIAKFLHSAIQQNIDKEIRIKFIEGYTTIRLLSQMEQSAIPIFAKAAHIWVMGIAASAAKDVLGYGSFDRDWLKKKLAMLRTLNI